MSTLERVHGGRAPAAITAAMVALAVVCGGCESSADQAGAPMGAGERASIREAKPGTELTLLEQVTGAATLTRAQLAGTVVAFQGGSLDGGQTAWAAACRDKGWLPAGLLAEPSRGVTCGEGARAVVMLVGVEGGPGNVASAVDGATALGALRRAGIARAEAVENEPLRGDRWLAWLGEARDRRDAGTRLALSSPKAAGAGVAEPARSGVAGAKAEPTGVPQARAGAQAQPEESFEDFGTSPAAASTSAAATRSPAGERSGATPPAKPGGQAAGDTAAGGASIPRPRPEPLAVRLDQFAGVADERAGGARERGESRPKRPAWVPGKPVATPPTKPAVPAPAPATAKPAGGGKP